MKNLKRNNIGRWVLASVFIIWLFSFLPIHAQDNPIKGDSLGIDLKQTKYKKGDVFLTPDAMKWKLIKWTEIGKDVFGRGIFRWKIQIRIWGGVAEAWTDDMWLDKLKQVGKKSE